MRTIRMLSSAVLLSIPLALAACSSDDNNPGSPTGSGGNGGSTGSGGGAGSTGSAGSGTGGDGTGGTTGGAGGSTGGSGGSSMGDAGGIKVGLITKEKGNPFFLKMRDGAQAEADKKGVTLISNLEAADNAAQVAEIDKQVAAGVKGILLVAADTSAIEAKITEVQGKGIIVIALDTPTKSDMTDALFATDNKAAGKLIGQYAKAALGGKAPKIITLDGPVGLTVSDLRHSGFLEGFYGTAASGDAGASDGGSADGGGSSQVACAEPTMGSQDTGKTAAVTCLGKVPDVNVIYTVNEPVAAGAYDAMLATDGGVKPANVIVVSVDGGCMGVQMVKDGKIAATSQQYPLKMAQLGVDAVVEFATSGKKPMPHYTDTGVNLITDKPFDAGFDSKDTTFGLMNCWGM